MSGNPYDLFYKQFDWDKEPFGCPLKHWLWYKKTFMGNIVKLKPKEVTGLILDVGGGTGIFFDFLSREEKIKYVNLDLSITLLKLSKGERVRGASEYIPFRDEAFLLVISSEVLEHVSDKLKTLKEIHRVLEEGGSLILTTPCSARDKLWNKTRYKLLYLLLRIFTIPFYVRRIVINKIRKRRIIIPQGLRDEPSDEEWLKDTLENMGFRIIYFSKLFVLWKGWIDFPIWLLQIMEKRYSGSDLCHALILKALKKA
jgi:ubiquinone/menaquinone biosynthesis C-methylase UbiE